MATFIMRTMAVPGPSRRLSKAALSVVSDYVVDADVLFNIDLILSEACANVVRHAYRDMKPGKLEILLRVKEPEFLEIEVSDWGRGLTTTPAEIKNADPEAEGGRGLYIMSTLSSEFDLRHDDGKHTVYLKLELGVEAWKPCS